MEEKKEKVGIVTDSVCDLPQEYLDELGNIRLVPFHVYFQNENKSYDEGVTISYEEFYAKLEKPELGMPKTQGPNQNEYLTAYEEMLKRYEKIVSLNMSSKMSVGYSSAQLARQMLPEADITIIDSGTVSMVLGLYVLEAARMAKAGASPQEIVARVEKARDDTVSLFMASTLKYIRQSGRVNQVAYLIGQALQVKPLFTFKNGMGEPAGRELSMERGYIKIAKTMSEKFGDRPVLATVVHSMAPDQAEQLKARLTQRLNIKELIVSKIGPTLGSHGGAGLVGAAAFPAD